LHRLRYELGDSAFFKGLRLYREQNRFKTAEAHNLRMALEERNQNVPQPPSIIPARPGRTRDSL